MKRIAAVVPWAIGGMMVIFALASIDVNFEGRKARPAIVKAQIANFLEALESYRSEVGQYPTEQQGLRALWIDPGVPGWKGPYMPRDIPPDPWGIPYIYQLSAGRPQIASMGGRGQKRKQAMPVEKNR